MKNKDFCKTYSEIGRKKLPTTEKTPVEFSLEHFMANQTRQPTKPSKSSHKFAGRRASKQNDRRPSAHKTPPRSSLTPLRSIAATSTSGRFALTLKYYKSLNNHLLRTTFTILLEKRDPLFTAYCQLNKKANIDI